MPRQYADMGAKDASGMTLAEAEVLLPVMINVLEDIKHELEDWQP